MLKPFQIRNLRVSQPGQSADSRTPAGVVQISATDYDDLASNHPRARLTYMDDDDDDETITVSSAQCLSIIEISLFSLGWIRFRALSTP